MLRCLFKAALSSIHCKGCFQPETWSFDAGEKFIQETKETLFQYLNNPVVTRLSILGGEPLEECNWKDLNQLLREVRLIFPHIKIWLYTGYEYEFLTNINNRQLKEILEKVDVLVAGPFIEDEKDLGLRWCGSRNQQVIRFDKTKK